MSKLNRLQKIILGIICAFVAIGVLLYAMSGSTSNNMGYSWITMIKYALIDHPTQTIKGFMSDFSTLWKVKEENDMLRSELSKNPSYESKADEYERENNELKALLGLETNDKKNSYINAEVITRDQANWNNQIVIDKGSNNDIVKGMAVISTKGMIGTVSAVTETTSTVTLLTSQDGLSKPPVKINIDENTSSEGIVESYDVNKGMFRIRLFTDNDKIEQGMQVVTSGKGGVYPAGLLVGTIETVQSLTNSVGQTIYAKPVEGFQTFSYVAVIGNSRSQ